MKLARTLGLAIVAAMVAMALLGTGTALAATEACYTKEKPCQSANLVPIGTKIVGVLQENPTTKKTEVKLKGVGTEAHCLKAAASGVVTVNPGTTETKEQVIGEIRDATAEECALGSEPPGSCRVNRIQTPYTAHVEQGTTIGEGTAYGGSLIEQGTEKVIGLQPGQELSTGCKVGLINLEGCIYKVKEEQPKVPGTGKVWGKMQIGVEGTGTEENTHLRETQVALKSSSFKCGTEVFVEAAYTVKAEPSPGVFKAIFVV